MSRWGGPMTSEHAIWRTAWSKKAAVLSVEKGLLPAATAGIRRACEHESQ